MNFMFFFITFLSEGGECHAGLYLHILRPCYYLQFLLEFFKLHFVV